MGPLWLSLLVVLAVTMSVPQVAAKRPVTQADAPPLRDLTATTSCSDTVPWRGLARLTWSTDAGPIANLRLDVTVYKGGFENQMFATLWPFERGRTFETRDTRLPDRPDKAMVNLKLTDVQTPAQQSVTTVAIDGLEPGVLYFWRLLTRAPQGWTPIGFARASGPVCPNDARSPSSVR